MYIWRGKNKRDEHFPTIFAHAGVKSDVFDFTSDDQVRLDNEEDHIDYFHEHVSTVLRKYLRTDRGQLETLFIRKALGKARLNDPEYAEKIKGTVPKKPSELAAEKAAAAAEKGETSPTKESKKSAKKGASLVGRVRDVFANKTPLAFLQPELLVEDREARDLIIESTVRKFERDALAEFRRAMPPDYSCPLCRESFGSALELEQHMKDDEVADYHAVLKDMEEQSAERTKYVDQMFAGSQVLSRLTTTLPLSVIP